MTPDLATARTWLFVPGNRPDRFAKALAAGADIVIVDLEDAVPPADKDMARAAVATLLDQGAPVVVRINAFGSPWHDADLALAGHPALAAIMLPKARHDAALGRLAARVPVVALIETAAGHAEAVAVAATPGVARLAFGAIDMALDLDLAGADDAVLDPLRLDLAIASRLAERPAPIDGVTPDVCNADALVGAVRRARTLGFAGKLCIHPAQVPAVHVALAPTADELAWARRVVAADCAAQGGAVLLDGAMIDRPVVARAKRILHAA